MNKKIIEQITQLSMDLKLPAFCKDIQAVITEAIKQNASHEQLILTLLTIELQQPMINCEKARLQSVHFTQLKYLQDLDKSELPEDVRASLPELETLELIKEGRNIILGGNHGTGKSHIAIGLGIKACMQGNNVMFTQISKLLTQIRKCHSSRTLRILKSRSEKYPSMDNIKSITSATCYVISFLTEILVYNSTVKYSPSAIGRQFILKY